MPYSWITPVTDRDYYRDVYVAQSELNKKKQNISYEIGFLKGCLNYTDLNRIENNMHVLAEMLSVSIAESTIWSNVSIPTNSEQSRILGSAVTVRSAFISKYPEMEEIESVPPLLLNWENFNQLERLQLTMYEKITEPQSYDETKIAVVKLDENMQKTDVIQYFDTIYDAYLFMYLHAGENFCHVHIGNRSQAVPTMDNDMYDSRNLYSIDIPEGVTAIPDNFFGNCTNLSIISIPSTIISIGYYAFSGASSLSNITIPSSVVTIEEGAFENCDLAIIINKPESSISGAPWGATNATITWTG